MTVCVAAFAHNEEAIVLISDKAVTYSGREIDMQADTGICKVLRLADSRWYALVAGTISFGEQVVRTISDKVRADPKLAQDLTGIMGCGTRVFAELWKEQMTAQILTPKLLTEDLLLRRPSNLTPLPASYFGSVTDEMNKFWIDSSILICGFDVRGKPHLIQIDAPGRGSTHNTMGYAAIGSGSDTAIGRLMWKETDRTFSLDRVLYEALDAKAHAELIQGVGYKWDAYVLVKGQDSAVEVPGHIWDMIDTAFNFANNNWPPYDPIPSEDLPTADWQQQVEKYARDVMSGRHQRKRKQRKRHKRGSLYSNDPRKRGKAS